MIRRFMPPGKNYDGFKRFWVGITLLSGLLTAIGSLSAGVGVFLATCRAFVVAIIVFAVGCILIKFWASWEEMKRGEAESRRR